MSTSCVAVLILLCVYFLAIVEGCEKQSDCPLLGFRCVHRVGKGFSVACELKPDNVHRPCKCRRGCLTCSGGRHVGISRFIRQGRAVKMGCGINYCGCAHASTNMIFCTLAACIGVSHCTPGGGRGGNPVFPRFKIASNS